MFKCIEVYQNSLQFIMILHLTEDACKLIATKDYSKIDQYIRKELSEKLGNKINNP
jgi:hypothetical protein